MRGFCLAGVGESSYHGVCHGNIEEIWRAKERRRTTFEYAKIGWQEIVERRPQVIRKKGESRQEGGISLIGAKINQTEIRHAKEVILPHIERSFRGSGCQESGWSRGKAG